MRVVYEMTMGYTVYYATREANEKQILSEKTTRVNYARDRAPAPPGG